MRGLGSPSCSAGMPNPPPKNRRLVRGWRGRGEREWGGERKWGEGRGNGGGEGRKGKGRSGDERSMYVAKEEVIWYACVHNCQSVFRF